MILYYVDFMGKKKKKKTLHKTNKRGFTQAAATLLGTAEQLIKRSDKGRSAGLSLYPSL